MSESEIQRRNQQKFSNFCSEIESLLEDGTPRLFFSFEIGYFYFYLIFIYFMNEIILDMKRKMKKMKINNNY